MSTRNTPSQPQPQGRTGPPPRLSRRRLLVTGTGALLGALPVLATAGGAATMDQASGRQRRIAAVLERHGPELGSWR